MDERRDDWRHGVDENLASLNAGQRIWERDLTLIRKAIQEIDRLLRGDPEKDTDGLMARLHRQENDLNLLKAVVLKDSAGNKGLIGRVESLEHGDHAYERRWKFATAVVVAIISLLGLILTNKTKIAEMLTGGRKDPIENAIERAKHPPRRHIRIKIDARTKPEETPSEGDDGQ